MCDTDVRVSDVSNQSRRFGTLLTLATSSDVERVMPSERASPVRHAPCSSVWVSEASLGEARTKMAVIARSEPRELRSARRFPRKLILTPLIFVAVALGAGASAQQAFATRALPGVMVGGVAVGSLERDAIREQGTALDSWVTQVSHDVDRTPVSGEIRVGTKGVEATQPVLGRSVDRTETIAALLSADSLGDREVALRLRTTYPELDASGFDEAYARAVAVTTPLTVHVEDRSWDESEAGLATLLHVERALAKPGDLAAIPAAAIAPTARYRYAVTVDRAPLATW